MLRSIILSAALFGGGCEPEESSTLAKRECELLLAAEEFSASATLARGNSLYSFAIPLLNRLRTETDYWKGCSIDSALCELTGVDVPYGCSVPEEDWSYWAQRRLVYWEAWLASREGRDFLNGKAAPSNRKFWGDDDLVLFLQSDAN